jgi:hypothetical protein
VKRIDAIFDVEQEINSRPAHERLAVRRTRVAPLVADLQVWMRAERGKLSRHSDVAKALDYMLKRWDAFTRFLEDGRICLTNNAAERALRGIAFGRPGEPHPVRTDRGRQKLARLSARPQSCHRARGRQGRALEWPQERPSLTAAASDGR